MTNEELLLELIVVRDQRDDILRRYLWLENKFRRVIAALDECDDYAATEDHIRDILTLEEDVSSTRNEVEARAQRELMGRVLSLSRQVSESVNQIPQEEIDRGLWHEDSDAVCALVDNVYSVWPFLEEE